MFRPECACGVGVWSTDRNVYATFEGITLDVLPQLVDDRLDRIAPDLGQSGVIPMHFQ